MVAFRKFLMRFVIFLLVAGVVLFCWNRFAPAERVLSYSWYIFGFFALATLGVHWLLLRSGDQKPQVFIRRFMAITSLKMLVYLMAAVLIAFSDRDHAVIFLAHFLAFYLIFTVFEVLSLYNHFRPKPTELS